MPFDRDKYPNLHRCLGAPPDCADLHTWVRQLGLPEVCEARRELDRLIAEREQAARLHARREAKAIVEALLSKVDDVMDDADALCRELGVER